MAGTGRGAGAGGGGFAAVTGGGAVFFPPPNEKTGAEAFSFSFRGGPVPPTAPLEAAAATDGLITTPFACGCVLVVCGFSAALELALGLAFILGFGFAFVAAGAEGAGAGAAEGAFFVGCGDAVVPLPAAVMSAHDGFAFALGGAGDA